MKKFNQIYTLNNVLQNGFIFTKMVNLDSELNFATSENDKQLDIHFYTKYCQNKYMSTLSEELHNEEDAGNIEDALQMLADILLIEYKDKWTKLFDVLTAEYNALSDVNISETETPNITESTNIDTRTEQDGENSGNVYGFNSEQETPANSGYSNLNSHNTADAESNYRTRTGSITRAKSGNYGDKSTLLKKELDARKNILYNIIYDDISEVLTLPIWL